MSIWRIRRRGFEKVNYEALIENSICSFRCVFLNIFVHQLFQIDLFILTPIGE